jgi:hypothetical protein
LISPIFKSVGGGFSSNGIKGGRIMKIGVRRALAVSVGLLGLWSAPALAQVSPSVQVHIISASTSKPVYMPETRYCVATSISTRGKDTDIHFSESDLQCSDRASVLSEAEVTVLRAEKVGPRD